MILGLLLAILAPLIVIMLENLGPRYISDMETFFAIGALVNYFAVLGVVWGWALRKKNRSLWWLLLGMLVPFGWIALLSLDDRSRASTLRELRK